MSVITHIANNAADYKAEIGTISGTSRAKIYTSVVPQGVKKPYARITLVSRPVENNKEERGPTSFQYQIDHYADTSAKAEACEKAFIAAITPYHNYKSTVAGENVRSIRLMNGGGSGYNEPNENKERMIEISIRINP